MSFYGVGLNAAVNKLQLEIKMKLSSLHGGTAIRKLAKMFTFADKNQNGKLDFYEFEDGLRTLGIFYRKIDSQALFNFYDKDKDGSISYKEFVDSFRTRLSMDREKFVKEVFRRLDVNGNGAICPKELGYLYQAHHTHEVVMGKMSSEQACNNFFALFDFNSDGKISYGEFYNYYCDVGSIIQGDESFIDLLKKTWGINFTQTNVDELQIRRWIGLIREKLVVQTSGVREEFKLREIYLSFDKSNSNLLSLEDFDAMLLTLGIQVPRSLLRPLFEALDTNKSGFIEFDEFQKFILYNPYK